MVNELCTKYACGLIFDVHGATMSGEIMRQTTQLHELAPSQGYVVVHPSAVNGGVWDLVTDPPIVSDFMSRMINAFHIDQKRIHMTGLSQGSGMTFWFLCNRPEVLASTGPVTGRSPDDIKVVANGESCLPSINANWKPQVPTLFMSGTADLIFPVDSARERAQGIVARLGLTGGDQIAGDSAHTRKRWQGSDGMVFDYLEHTLSSATVIVAGHCIPGGPADSNIFNCVGVSGSTLHWGKTVLQWFIDHPKP